jgi:Cu/Ag efflux protein CusF
VATAVGFIALAGVAAEFDCRVPKGGHTMKMTITPFVSRVAVLGFAAVSIAVAAGCGKQEADNASPSMQSMPDNEAASNQESMKDMPMPDTSAPGPSAETQTHATRGTIQSVDREAGTVKIAHEAVPALNWSAMTMDFKVADKQALAGLKEGEQVEFHFTEESAGQYAITHISPQR